MIIDSFNSWSGFPHVSVYISLGECVSVPKSERKREREGEREIERERGGGRRSGKSELSS